MKKKVLPLFSLLIGFLGFSQTEVYFKYDEAGNQRYRGSNANARQASELEQQTESKVTSLSEFETIGAEKFWKQIQLYPVPVDDILTIAWTVEADDLIESVSLYQHNTVHWKFQKKIIPSLDKRLQINMSGYEWGVYILRFTLKDGRVFSKNITKN